MKLNSKQLRKIDETAVVAARDGLKRQDIYLILENIFDTYNVGGLFRLADGLGVQKVYLCAGTSTPPNNRIHKASCGTYKVVPWAYTPTVQSALEAIKIHQKALNDDRRLEVVAIEQSTGSIPYQTYKPTLPLAIVVGNETTGVTPESLALCDHILEIPMWGINISLNVIVSAGIVSYHCATSQ